MSLKKIEDFIDAVQVLTQQGHPMVAFRFMSEIMDLMKQEECRLSGDGKVYPTLSAKLRSLEKAVEVLNHDYSTVERDNNRNSQAIYQRHLVDVLDQLETVCILIARIQSRGSELSYLQERLDEAAINFNKKIKPHLTMKMKITIGLVALLSIVAIITTVCCWPKRPGILMSYYHLNTTDNEKGSFIKSVDADRLDFNWGGGEIINGMKDNLFIKWTGTLVAPETGVYSFTAYCDDGCRLMIDGNYVLNEWRTQFGKFSSRIYLEAGQHSFLCEYFQIDLGSILTLSWKTPIMGEEALPVVITKESFLK